MTNLSSNEAVVKWTETGAERLVRVALEMREHRMAAQRDDLKRLVDEGRVSAKAAGFATLLCKVRLTLRLGSELAATVWELLGAYAM